MNEKRVISLNKMIALICMICTFFIGSKVFAATKSVGIDSFPSSYQIYLKQIQKLHPNWTYTALNTGIDWNTVIKNEGPSVDLKRSAIGISFADVWKWKNSNGAYNLIEPGWVTASELAVAYSMDPRKYINEMQIFQFETLNYDSSVQNQTGVEKIFYGTLMYQRNIVYIDTKGKTQTINKTYSKVVMEAAAKYGVSPYHLASRIKQETGCDIQNNTSIKGNVSGYVGLYNYFNIGATGGSNPAISGLAYARSVGWTTPELAINGGAEFLSQKYINKGQYTTYLQKFNVNDNSSYSLYTHQYMQNILAPSSEAVNTHSAYSKMGLLDIPFNFVIPVYDNMPNLPVDIYTENPSDYVKDSTKVYCTSNLNIRSGAGTGNSALLTAPKGTVMTRIARGVQAGERWDKVRLDTGLEGYVFQSYIKECSYTKVTGVQISSDEIDVEVGKETSLKAEVLPSNATYKDVTWSSSDSNIVSVSQDGKVTGVKEGMAYVTVKSDDQLKEARCVVNVVKKKEPKLELDKDTYIVLKGKSTKLNITTLNVDNPEYEIAVQNEEIAKVEENKIYGIEEGETNITISLVGTTLKVQAKVKVVDIKEGEIKINESIKVEEDIISKIEPETTISSILDKIETSYDVKVKEKSGKNLGENDIVGTGSKVQILDSAGAVIYEYTVLIYGDVTGDGKITSKDYMAIKNHIMETSILNQIEQKAADSFRDGNITSKDYMIIKNYIMGVSKINQE